MAFSGSNSYFTQREMIGSGNNSNNIQQEPPTLYPFQSQPLETSSVYGGGGSSGSVLLPGVVQRGGGGEVVVRRKRGRPRKYGSSDLKVPALVSPPPPSSSSAPVPPHVTSSSNPSVKRGRGRPPGGGKRHQLSSFGGWLSSSAGIGFTPHVISVSIGEDIATKIISFSQQGPRAICVLCANGSVSTATLRQPSSSSGGTVTYEGQFEILCLSGSFLLTADSASFSRAGGLSVTLASSDGRVIGGGVGGVLRAATPIQVVVGSFLTGNLKGKQRDDESTEESNPNPNPNPNPIHQIFEDSFTPTNVHQNRNSMSTSSMGMWQTSHQDVQSSHADIDLMH